MSMINVLHNHTQKKSLTRPQLVHALTYSGHKMEQKISFANMAQSGALVITLFVYKSSISVKN